MLNTGDCSYEMFDDALMNVYENIQELFKKYKVSDEYQILIDNLNLNSYIKCKMSNTGLVNRYWNGEVKTNACDIEKNKENYILLNFNWNIFLYFTI